MGLPVQDEPVDHLHGHGAARGLGGAGLSEFRAADRLRAVRGETLPPVPDLLPGAVPADPGTADPGRAGEVLSLHRHFLRDIRLRLLPGHHSAEPGGGVHGRQLAAIRRRAAAEPFPYRLALHLRGGVHGDVQHARPGHPRQTLHLVVFRRLSLAGPADPPDDAGMGAGGALDLPQARRFAIEDEHIGTGDSGCFLSVDARVLSAAVRQAPCADIRSDRPDQRKGCNGFDHSRRHP